MTGHAVALETVGRTLGALLDRSGRQLTMLDRTSGEPVTVARDLATSPTGFLPVFLVAADAVWRDATGKSFGIGLARDPASLLGFRSESIGHGPFSAIMLSMMEAIEQTARPGVLLMNDFDTLWRSIDAGMGMAVRVGIGPRPSPSPGQP